jgi:hypothetical protein
VGGKTLVTQIDEWIEGEGEKAEVPTLPTFNMPEIALLRPSKNRNNRCPT